MLKCVFCLQTVATSCVLTVVPWTRPRAAANALESTRGPPAPRVSSDIIRTTSWFVNPFQSYRPLCVCVCVCVCVCGGEGRRVHWHFSSQNLCHKHVNRVHSTSSESYISDISWRWFSPQNVCQSHVNRVHFELPDPEAVSISDAISSYRPQVNSPHKSQWHGALICAWPNGWVNNRDAGDLRRHRIHYDVIVMFIDYHMLNLSRFPSTENCKPDPDYCGKPQPMGFEKFHCTQWTNVPDECPNMCGLCWGAARMDKQQKHNSSGSNKYETQSWHLFAIMNTPLRHTKTYEYILLQNTNYIQSSAVITRSSIVRYHINNFSNWVRTSIRCWIHKRRPIPRPNGLAMGCLLWIFVRKLTA